MKTKLRRSDKGREEEMVKTTIRLPASFMERIDALISVDEIQLSKNVWFLQAVKEKLEREEKRKG